MGVGLMPQIAILWRDMNNRWLYAGKTRPIRKQFICVAHALITNSRLPLGLGKQNQIIIHMLIQYPRKRDVQGIAYFGKCCYCRGCLPVFNFGQKAFGNLAFICNLLLCFLAAQARLFDFRPNMMQFYRPSPLSSTLSNDSMIRQRDTFVKAGQHEKDPTASSGNNWILRLFDI